MKKIISIITTVLIVINANNSFAQSSKKTQTISFPVQGNCNDCKERIENAAYIKGVKEAKWDKKSKTMTVVYRNDKTSLEKIEAAILKTGHNVDTLVAPNEVYNQLPSCCQYRDHDHTH